MAATDRSPEELYAEIKTLRARIAELEQAEAERKGAEDALRESEEKYRSVVDNIGVGIAVIQDGQRVYRNSRMRQIFGYSEQEYRESDIIEAIHPDDRQVAVDAIRRQLTGEVPETEWIELRVFAKSGEMKWIESGAVVIDWEGKPAVQAFLHDVTERKRAEEALRRSEEQYRTLFEYTHAAVLVTDPDGSVVSANPAVAEMLGYQSPTEMIGTQVGQYYVDPAQSGTILAELMEKGSVEDRVTALKRRDGSVVHTIGSANVVKDETGSVLRIEGIFTDITERVQAEEALQESEAKYRSLTTRLPIGVYRTDRDGRILFANPALAKLLGYDSVEELTTETTARERYVDPRDREEHFKRWVAEGGIGQDEELLLRKDGTQIWVRDVGRIVMDEEGEVKYCEGTLEDITERKQAEEAYRALVDHSLQGLLIVQDGRIVFANQALPTMSGYTIEELLGLSHEEVQALIHPEDREFVWERAQERLAGEQVPEQYEFRFVRKDGSYRWVEQYTSLIEYKGKPAAQTAYVDITERKRAEEALRESEERYRNLFEDVPIGLYQTTPAGQILDANAAWIEMLGYPDREALQAAGATALYSDPEDRRRWQNNMEREGMVRDFEVQIRRHDGETIWVQENARAIRDETGRVLYYRGSQEDITERKQAEEALRESEEKYRDLVENMNDIVYSVDEKGMMTYVSPVIETFIGYPPSEVVGRPFTDFIYQEDLQRIRENYQQILSGHPSEPNEYRVLTRTGGIRWMRTSSQPIFVEDRVVGVHGMLVDITERVQAEEEIKRRNRELAALQATVLDITTQQDLSTLLQTIIERAVSLLDARGGGGLYLCDPDREEARCLVSYKTPSDYTGTVLKYGEGAAGTVAQTGEPLLIDDYRTWSGRAAAFEEDRPFSAVLSVPMTWQGQVTGVIHVLDDAERRQFTQADLELLGLFANHAAIAVENTRLHESTRGRAMRLELVEHIGRRATAILDLDELLPAAANLIGQAFGYYSTQIGLVEGDDVVLQTSTRPEFQKLAGRLRSPLGEGSIVGWVAGSGEALLAPDVTKEPCFYFMKEAAETKSELTVPIRLQHRVIGVVDVQSNQLDDFSKADLHTLQTVADQLAVAIENARLYEREQRHAVQLEALRRVTLDISAELDLDTLLEALTESALKLLGAKSGGLYLHRPERDVLEWTMQVGPETVPLGTELKRGEGLSGKVWESGSPLWVDNYAQWAGHAAKYEGYPWTAILGVPVRRGDEFLGVVNALADASQRTFTESDAHLLSLFADQAAVAILNAQLHQSTRERAARLELISRVSQRTTAILERDELLYQAVNLLGDAFGYHSTQVLLVEGDHIVLAASTDPVLRPLEGQLRLRIGAEGITGWVAGSGEPFLVPDVAREPRYRHVDEEIGTKSELAVPIKLKDIVIGVLDVQSGALNAFSEADIPTLQTIADQLAISIENARLYQELEAHSEVLEEAVKERTAELQTANEHLQALSRVKDEFVSNVSHELRTPITTMRIHYGLLEMDPDALAKSLPVLRRETERLSGTIEDLLRLSGLDQDRVALEFAAVDLNVLASQYVADRQPLAEGKELALTFAGQENLPSVQADDGLLGQVLSILLTNALNYTPAGGSVAISTQSREEDGQLWAGFSVSDTGPGIPLEEQRQVFERFFRGVAGCESGEPGTGLGLSLAREIVERHRGQMELASAGIPGKGATFTVWLLAEGGTHG